jgi:hypothetical protein
MAARLKNNNSTTVIKGEKIGQALVIHVPCQLIKMRSEHSFTEILSLLITRGRGTCVSFYGSDVGSDIALTTSTIKIRKGQQ